MSHNSKNTQQGSALVIAVFIIVVMALLAAVLARLLSGSSMTAVAEVSGQRALNAASSGVELYLAELFSGNSTDCPDTILESSEVTSYPLKYCEAEVRCRRLDLSSLNNTVHYRIKSTGRCDVGEETYRRDVIVEASDGN